jgi:hypothetical protein
MWRLGDKVQGVLLGDVEVASTEPQDILKIR